MLVCVHACSSVFLFSPSLPPSFPLCVYYLSLSLFLSFSVSPSLSLVSSDNVIPHWSDDVMPCPQVITLPSSRFCYKFAVHFVRVARTQCMYLISPLYRSGCVHTFVHGIILRQPLITGAATYHLHICWSHISPSLPHSSLCSPFVPPPPPPLSSLV